VDSSAGAGEGVEPIGASRVTPGVNGSLAATEVRIPDAEAEAALSALHRRVVSLEREALLRDAELRSTRVELDAANAELGPARAGAAELIELKATRTFRWTARPRAVYGRRRDRRLARLQAKGKLTS
jgi:hypothetical protein